MLHITLQCLHLVLNTNVYKMIETSQGVLHVFLYKPNAYKHIQPGISEQNKHMLNIVSNFENSYSFFFVSSIIQRHIQNHVKHLR